MIQDAQNLLSDHTNFLLYSAFKAALKRLLNDIESACQNPGSCRLILIHGVPMIGKSALARCLAYYLALVRGKVKFIQLLHTNQYDCHALTKDLCNNFEDDVVILDQCNVNALDCNKFFEKLLFRKDSGKDIPVIMFTSGHYSPSKDWLDLIKPKYCSFKIISMQMDESAVDTLRDRYEVPDSNEVISTKQLLQITSIFGRMQICVSFLSANNTLDKDALEDKIYQTSDIRILKQESMYHFVWLAWKDYVKELPDEKDLKSDDFALQPELVQYFGYLTSTSGVKDAADEGMNRILNWLDIGGECLETENGYRKYNPENYVYLFPCQRPILLLLSDVVAGKYSVKAAYTSFRQTYQLLQKKNVSCTAFLEGVLYEQLINLYLKLSSGSDGERYGLSVVNFSGDEIGNTVAVINVNSHCTASTVEELCQLATKPPLGEKNWDATSWRCWVVLNVERKAQFKGYDFALLVVLLNKNIPKKPKVKELQLFQATINPAGKSAACKSIMLEALLEIESNLKAKMLIDGDERVVTPYFLCPDMHKCKSYELKSETKRITTHVVKFGSFEKLNV